MGTDAFRPDSSQGGGRGLRPSEYPEEFRGRGAPLVIDGGRGVWDVAPERDVGHKTLRNRAGALKREPGIPVVRSGPMSGRNSPSYDCRSRS